MSIKAFKSSRVTEALHAIEVYVNHAWELADAVEPSDTLKLEFEGEEEPEEAEVTEVTWTASDSSIIELSDLGDPPEIKVEGENLTHAVEDEHGNVEWVLDVASLRLIGPDGAGPSFVATAGDFHDVDDGEFVADLTLVDGTQPQLGSYEAVIVTVGGDVEVLSNACAIVPDKTKSKDDILKVLIINRRRGRGHGKGRRKQQNKQTPPAGKILFVEPGTPARQIQKAPHAKPARQSKPARPAKAT